MSQFNVASNGITNPKQYTSIRLQVEFGDILYTFHLNESIMAKFKNYIKECAVYNGDEFVSFCHHALLCQIKDKQIKIFTINDRKYALFNCDLYLKETDQEMFGMIHITTDINGQDIMDLVVFANKINAITKLGFKSDELPLSSIEAEGVKEKLVSPIAADLIECIPIREFKEDCIQWIAPREIRPPSDSQYIFGVDKYEYIEDIDTKAVLVTGWVHHCFDLHSWPQELSVIAAKYLPNCWRAYELDVCLDYIRGANRLFGLRSKLVLSDTELNKLKTRYENELGIDEYGESCFVNPAYNNNINIIHF